VAKEDIALRLSLIDGVSRSIADIRKNVNDLGASIVKVNAAAELTGKTFDAIKTAGGFLADQVTSVGNFEQSLAALQAVTGASAEELDRLKNAAVAASQASIFSSTEAADGLAELARAGYSASDAISTLNPVLALAQGQQLSVAESSKFVTTTLTQFGLAATDAE
jgi:glucuronate isomerase